MKSAVLQVLFARSRCTSTNPAGNHFIQQQITTATLGRWLVILQMVRNSSMTIDH